MRRNWEDAIQQIAREDPKFREALKRDPKAAIEEKIGAKLPGNIKVNVAEETPDTAWIVLPMDSATEAEAIRAEAASSEMEPAPMSGGTWSTCGKELTCWCVTTTTCDNAATVHGSC